MKQEDNPNSNLTEAELSEHQRKEAIERFIDPTKRPRVKTNWLKIAIWISGSVLVVGVLVTVLVYETNKPTKPVLIPSTFDVSAIKSTIGANDSVQMTLDECTKIAPPYWNAPDGIMTVPIPVLFSDNRIPTLSVEKTPNPLDEVLNQISISGFESGDVIISPIDGEIQITIADENLSWFSLFSKDAQGNDDIIMQIRTSPNGLNPLINFNVPTTEQQILIAIKKGQPIGEITTPNTSIMISADGPSTEGNNLATTPEGKVIILTK
jgi:hypothetical protein